MLKGKVHKYGADVLNGVLYFIEEVYNMKRLHSALDYQLPLSFEIPALACRNRNRPAEPS